LFVAWVASLLAPKDKPWYNVAILIHLEIKTKTQIYG
jgi:hypothetical protein